MGNVRPATFHVCGPGHQGFASEVDLLGSEYVKMASISHSFLLKDPVGCRQRLLTLVLMASRRAQSVRAPGTPCVGLRLRMEERCFSASSPLPLFIHLSTQTTTSHRLPPFPVSHELRTPLNQVLISADLLEHELRRANRLEEERCNAMDRKVCRECKETAGNGRIGAVLSAKLSGDNHVEAPTGDGGGRDEPCALGAGMSLVLSRVAMMYGGGAPPPPHPVPLHTKPSSCALVQCVLLLECSWGILYTGACERHEKKLMSDRSKPWIHFPSPSVRLLRKEHGGK